MGPLTRPVKGARQSLKTTTLRGFSGGLNVLDDDMDLSHKYAVQSTNIFSNNDGTMAVRYDVSLFKDITTVDAAFGGAVNITYFNASLVVVGTSGRVARILANGTTTIIWNATLAALLPGAPAGWSTTAFASFAQFNGKLVICNGIDKPIIIDQTFHTDYLQDIPTASNINVPICRYVVSCQRFLVMAGDPLYPNRVHISARDASGTWFGDPAPNDGTHLDIGSIVESANIIRGLVPFRDKLLVLFAEGIVIGTLGIYNAAGTAHTPDFNDGIKDYGCVAHRSALTVGDDGLLASLTGISSIKRTILSNLLKPENASGLIDPLYTSAIKSYSLDNLADKIFSVYDRRIGHYLAFIPHIGGSGGVANSKTVFAYNYRPQLRQDAWSIFGDTTWNYTCGCASLEGTLFFGNGNGVIYVYGSRDNVITGNVSWTWETPWLDFGDRAKSKEMRYISFDTRGYGNFTVSMYVDNYLGGAARTATFGFGDSTATRHTDLKKLIAWPCKFQICKFIFTGVSSAAQAKADSFVAITLQYLLGGNRL